MPDRPWPPVSRAQPPTWWELLFGFVHHPLRLWTRQDWGKAGLALLSVLLISSCVVAGVVASLAHVQSTNPNHPPSAGAVSATETAITFQVAATSTTNAAAQPTATATPRPTSTASAPHIIIGATLGGTQAAFTAAFGQPVTQGAAPNYAFTTSSGLSGKVCFCVGWPGTDGQQRLDTLEAVSGGWGYDQCGAVLSTFFPPDAQAVTTITDPFLGPLQVFRSADLTQTFPAADFTYRGPGGGLVPPGTFSVVAQDPAQRTCGMNIGE